MKINVGLYYVQYEWEKKGQFCIYSIDMQSNPAYRLVKEFEIDVDVPECFSPIDLREENLRKQREELLKELASIEQKLSAVSQ